MFVNSRFYTTTSLSKWCLSFSIHPEWFPWSATYIHYLTGIKFRYILQDSVTGEKRLFLILGYLSVRRQTIFVTVTKCKSKLWKAGLSSEIRLLIIAVLEIILINPLNTNFHRHCASTDLESYFKMKWTYMYIKLEICQF